MRQTSSDPCGYIQSGHPCFLTECILKILNQYTINSHCFVFYPIYDHLFTVPTHEQNTHECKKIYPVQQASSNELYYISEKENVCTETAYCWLSN